MLVLQPDTAAPGMRMDPILTSVDTQRGDCHLDSRLPVRGRGSPLPEIGVVKFRLNRGDGDVLVAA